MNRQLREISISLSEPEWRILFNSVAMSTEMIERLPADMVPMQKAAITAGKVAQTALRKKLGEAGVYIE